MTGIAGGWEVGKDRVANRASVWESQEKESIEHRRKVSFERERDCWTIQRW